MYIYIYNTIIYYMVFLGYPIFRQIQMVLGFLAFLGTLACKKG